MHIVFNIVILYWPTLLLFAWNMNKLWQSFCVSFFMAIYADVLFIWIIYSGIMWPFFLDLNTKKGALDSQSQVRKFTSCLPMVGGSLRVLGFLIFNIDKSERYCNLCNVSELGEEFHYLFKCTFFNNVRAKFLPRNICNNPNILKFKELMNTSDLFTF
jgi:hypothetical protein